MPEPIPTQHGDVLILRTKDSAFSIYAVGPVSNDGEQDFFTGLNVQYVHDHSTAVDAAKAMTAPGRRIFFRNLDTGEWSEIAN